MSGVHPNQPDVTRSRSCTPFEDARFTRIALVQIGGDAQAPLDWAEREPLPARRAA